MSWIVSAFMPDDKIPDSERAPLESLRHWIERHTGIHYKGESNVILYSRLVQLCAKYSLDSLEHLVQALNKGDSELSLSVAQYVSTTYTHFFREPESIDFFNTVILPARLPVSGLRIWSVAASSGEEAYTLAICIAEKYGLSGLSCFQILGTDINAMVIRQAETGIYHVDRLRDISPLLRVKYFRPVGLDHYQVIPELRQICTFRRFNLHSEDWPFRNQFHAALCRNVLYYFQKSQQNYVVNKLHQYIVPQGYLITSVTESLSQLNSPWQMLRPALYRK